MTQNNRISIKVLFTCLLLSFTVQCCAATTVTIADITADPGDTVTVSIMINGIEGYGTATINLEYDSAIVFVEEVTGSSDSTVTAKNINNTAGLARISAWDLNGVAGDIVFADVKMKAVGNSGDSTPLTLTVDMLQNISYNKIPVTISGGSFTIAGQASIMPTPTPTPPIPSTYSGGTSTSSAPQNRKTDTNPASLQSGGEVYPTPHDTETDTNPSTHPAGENKAHPTPQSATKSTPKSSSTMPGFEGVLLIIGLLTVYMIARRGYQ